MVEKALLFTMFIGSHSFRRIFIIKICALSQSDITSRVVWIGHSKRSVFNSALRTKCVVTVTRSEEGPYV